MSNAADIIEAATRAANPAELEPESRYAVVVPPEGHLEVIPPVPDADRDHPRRTTGTATVLDVPSFKELWDKHSDPTSEAFADPQAHTITAVLNADAGAGDLAGHRDHRLVLDCRLTDAWKAWAGNDGRLLLQRDFAEHIEDRVIDVVEPTGADMLELAQSFEANSSVRFKSASVLSSSERQLVFEETIAAKAGQEGRLQIPATFVIGIAPFEGGDAYRITCRLRYRINNGVLTIGYKMERPEDVLRNAFTGTANAVSEEIGRTVLTGVAPAPRA